MTTTVIPPPNASAYEALKWFKETPKTESAMYIRFQTMPTQARRVLAAFYGRDRDMDLFSLICKWWGVKCAQGLACFDGAVPSKGACPLRSPVRHVPKRDSQLSKRRKADSPEHHSPLEGAL
ncbi:MAG: hypothetical protein P8Z79_00795 [Sedimentisphaerales bacterium]